LTVVIVGADGAGKSSVSTRLIDELPVEVRRIYLGANPDARTHLLPLSRAVRWTRSRGSRVPRAGGPPPVGRSLDDRPTGAWRRARRAVRAGARVTNQIAEETYQQTVIGWHHARGRVVVCDRHPAADHFAHDLAAGADQRPSRRVHGAFIRRCIPAPDLVLVLDAEPAVLHARKGEGTLLELEVRRAEYLAYAGATGHSVVIDASRPLDEVVDAARRAVDEELAR
jgi:thymidylate kinase